MEIKVINQLNSESLYYPVGGNIKNALNVSKKYFEAFKELFTYKIKSHAVNYVNIWCRGSSGSILSSLFYSQLVNEFPDLYVVVYYIRKPNEDTHGSSNDLSFDDTAINIIIDDFISSGSTINYIMSEFIKIMREDTNIDIIFVGKGFRLKSNEEFTNNYAKRVDLILTDKLSEYD